MEDGGRSYLANDLLGSWDQQGTTSTYLLRMYVVDYVLRTCEYWTYSSLVFFVWMLERSGTREGSVTVVDRSVGRSVVFPTYTVCPVQHLRPPHHLDSSASDLACTYFTVHSTG